MGLTERLEIRRFAATVADALRDATNDPWQVGADEDQANDYSAYILGNGAEKLWLSTWRQKGRVEVNASYPQNAVYPSPDSCDITVSQSRPAEAIAREIVRRVLPKYREELARVLKDNEDRNLARAARIELSRELSGLVDTTPYREDRFDSSSTEIRFYLTRGDRRPSGDISVKYRADHVSIKVDDLTPDQARRILAIVAEQED